MIPTIAIVNEPLLDAQIHPFQYGQFIEYLADLVPGMWAEKLYDNGFEGLSSYTIMRHIVETDFKEQPWYPTGATNRAEWIRDETDFVSPTRSMKIQTEGETPCTLGIAQDGVAVAKGETCTLTLWLKQKGVASPVKVAIRDGSKILAIAEFAAKERWSKHQATLTPSATCRRARIEILFKGPGTLWIDNASLMPNDNVKGWRKDVVAALKALKPGIIRTGGSVLEHTGYGIYDWRWTVGDPDRRRPFRSWGGLQPSGPGLVEFVELCRLVDSEPLICLPFHGKTPESAAEHVEYFNGSVETPMGKKRAEDGHPEPLNVKYWQVGNEQFGPEFDNGVRAFCEAVKKIDPSVVLFSCHPTEGSIKNAGDFIAYVCPHHYGCDNLGWCQSEVDNFRKMIAENAPGRDIKLAITEWNTTAGDAGPKRGKLWTLENALAVSRYHNLMHRNCDMIEVSNRSNLTNSFCSGIIQTDRYRLYKTPAYYAQFLYSNYAGVQPLKATAEGVDVSATLSKDGQWLSLFLVNDSLQSVDYNLELSGWGEGPFGGDKWTLADRDQTTEPDATNSFDDSLRIAPRKVSAKVRSGDKLQLPKLSLTVLKLKVR